MNTRLTTLHGVVFLLAAGSALAQTGPVRIFQAEDAITLGTNYVSVVDTNTPPFAYDSAFIAPLASTIDAPQEFDDRTAVYSLGQLPIDTYWDLYLRVHVGPDAFNDDSIFVASEFWDSVATNVYAEFINNLAGVTGLDGAPATAEGFHWVPIAVEPYFVWEDQNWWACAPREDGLELDAFAVVWSGFPVTDAMLDPANAAVELWPGAFAPAFPGSTPFPEISADFLDGAGSANAGSATVTLNGSAVSTFSVTYSNFVTTISFVPTTPLASPSINTVRVVMASTPGGTLVTNEFSFEVQPPGEPGNLVYVDVDTVNTLAWDGSTYTNWVPDGVTNWTTRAGWGNYDTAYQSEGGQSRLRTTVSGLPNGLYKVYAYWWSIDGGYRIDVALSDNPSGSLPTYLGSQYPADTDLYVHYLDAFGALPWGDWGNPSPNPFYSDGSLMPSNPFGSDSILLARNNQRLVQQYLGLISGTEFTVYVDDTGASGHPNRVWYDGVGYESVEDPVVVLSRSPEPNRFVITPDDFPLSLGGALIDAAETLDTGSVEFHLNGTNLLTGGDVVKTAGTTTVRHVVASLPDGAYAVDLVYATAEAPSVYYTNSWSFEAVTRPEDGSRVYVDADTTNTLAWNGSTFAAFAADATGSNWTTRTGWGNGDVVYQSFYDGNSPRLKTTLTGLPDATYNVYAYFFAAGVGQTWRMEAALTNSVSPGGELPVYIQSDYPANPRLYVHYQDGLGVDPWGTFANPPAINPYFSTDLLANPFGTNVVKLAHNDQRLVEVYLGTVTGTEITVYVDDDSLAAGGPERTWYDGIGYEEATGVTLDPVVSSLSVSGGTATLTWSSEGIGTYTIAHKAALGDADWTPVKTGIAGGEPTTTDSVPLSGATGEFFQIQGN